MNQPERARTPDGLRTPGTSTLPAGCATRLDRNLPGPRPDGRRVLCVLRWPVGGIRTYLLYNYPILAEAGYRFTFVGPADGAFRKLCEELGGWEGVEFIEATVRGRRCLLRRTVRTLMRAQRFDLVHAQGMTAAVEVALAGLQRDVPSVATLHDVFRPGQFAGATGRAKLWLLGRLLRRLDVIVAVSEDARGNYLEHLPGFARGGRRLVAIPNGIEVDRFARQRNEPTGGLRARLGIDPSAFLIGFLGRFMVEKGFLVLVDALERLARRAVAAPFHVVAVGNGDYEQQYRQAVDTHGLSDRVSFVGFVPDVAPILGDLDLVVVPSVSETCPLLPMEAMSVGVPVLGSDCIGLREVLRGSPSVMFRAGDPEALCDALQDAIGHPWTAAAAAYAPAARDRFDVRRSAGELTRLFDGLAPRPDPVRLTPG